MNFAENISENDRNAIVKMALYDSDSYRFLWDCVNNRFLQLNCDIFPKNIESPLSYMLKHEWVEEKSRNVFATFGRQIAEGITHGTSSSNLNIDLSAKFADDEQFQMYHFNALFLKDDNERINFVLITVKPFTTKELYEKEIVSFFTSDKNPQYYTQRIKNMMTKYADKNIAFIQFDVERFKLINDNYGVEVGDALLQFFSDSLSLICSDDQPYCRLTIDLFMIVTVYETENDIVDFIRMIEKKLSGYMGMDYRLVFGVAIVEDRTLHTRQHGDNATLARQAVKGNALNNIGFYNGKLKTALYHQHGIETEMGDALLNNEFVMYLQPKHCISTGKIIGAEALARWNHHNKGLIPPSEFIPVFEKNGFIVKLDQYMWECACRKIRSWIDNGITPIPISVNISREDLHHFDVVEKLQSLVKKYDIPIGLLELEITETVDSAATAEIVKKMKEVGFTMLMDDFGSGYSSLNLLKTTPFDVLKIDRSFLSEFMESDRGRKIISHTISMSRDIGLDIIAEGVENYEQAQFLKECGCDAAQGFYYSHPISENEFDVKLIEVNGT